MREWLFDAFAGFFALGFVNELISSISLPRARKPTKSPKNPSALGIVWKLIFVILSEAKNLKAIQKSIFTKFCVSRRIAESS